MRRECLLNDSAFSPEMTELFSVFQIDLINMWIWNSMTSLALTLLPCHRDFAMDLLVWLEKYWRYFMVYHFESVSCCPVRYAGFQLKKLRQTQACWFRLKSDLSVSTAVWMWSKSPIQIGVSHQFSEGFRSFKIFDPTPCHSFPRLDDVAHKFNHSNVLYRQCTVIWWTRATSSKLLGVAWKQ